MTENLSSTRVYPASGRVMPGADPGHTGWEHFWMDELIDSAAVHLRD